MPEAVKVTRIRAGVKPDPYNPQATGVDWEHPDTIILDGFIASSSSMQTADRLDMTVESSATLTCPDPEADIKVGDIVHPFDDPSRRWRVIGIPSNDRNPFTGWRPTLEAQLREVQG